MNIQEFAKLIHEHSLYCQTQYQPDKLPHLSLEKALDFMDRMQQSLTHFAMWIDTVKSKEES